MSDSNSGNMFVPKQVFFTKGMGKHKNKLNSFELALRNAGVEKYNLVSVSSILPPNCKIVSREKGLEGLSPGQIVFVVLAQNSSNEPNRLISASIGAAIPKDRSRHGYLSEHHDFGMKEKVCGDYAEDMAAEMLASTLGIDFDPDASYDEKKEIWKIHGHVYKTRNTTQSAVCDKNGLWTTVISAAVFIMG